VITQISSQNPLAGPGSSDLLSAQLRTICSQLAILARLILIMTNGRLSSFRAIGVISYALATSGSFRAMQPLGLQPRPSVPESTLRLE
jgi:hypothetical protein